MQIDKTGFYGIMNCNDNGRGKFRMDTKSLGVLKEVFKSVGRSDLYLRIATQKGKKQQSAITEGFKVLTSQLNDNDTAYLRQLRETIAQVDSKEVRTQLNAILDGLFVNEGKKSVIERIALAVKSKRGYKPTFEPSPESQPKKFDWGIFHKGKA